MHGWGQARTPDQVTTDVGLLNLMDQVAVPTTHSARLLSALGVSPSRTAVVPYGVRSIPPRPGDADRAMLAEIAEARRAGHLVVACIGTLGVRKNQPLLVEAVARLSDLRLLCLFVGDGDDRPLREAVSRHGCADRIRLQGYSRGARAIAAEADLLVLPSQSGGQQVSMLEAFCDGTLVAVSDVPELLEHVEDGVTGLVFPADDAGALAAAITRVAALSPEQRLSMREAARARYLAHFTVSRMVERYAALYTALVDRASSLRPHRRTVSAA
jgi:glycosyltransferase involved in cell wall biosynthesis